MNLLSLHDSAVFQFRFGELTFLHQSVFSPGTVCYFNHEVYNTVWQLQICAIMMRDGSTLDLSDPNIVKHTETVLFGLMTAVCIPA